VSGLQTPVQTLAMGNVALRRALSAQRRA